MDRAVVEIDGDDAAAAAVLVHHQVDGEIFDEEFGRWRSAWPYMVCSMAWPVRSAAAQVRCAVPLP